tara:strand:- start:1405 stop:2574 length:1170 start_codon:yes stop_codon:yes gene_type:complete
MVFINTLISLFKKKILIKTLKKKLYPYFRGLLLLLFPKKNKIKLTINKFNKIDKSETDLAKRIFDFYKLLKKEELNKDEIYRPSTLWQQHIDRDFKFLIESYNKDDLEQFTLFLQNFGNWENYLGIENQILIKNYNKNILLRKFLKDEIFFGQYKFWKFFNLKEDLSEVNFPRHGNQIGATVDENFFVLGSFFNEIYAKILCSVLDQNKRNIILDIGAGYGKFGYYIVKKIKNATFIDIDIPENLILASYFLSKSFTSKKVFFYGEKKFDQNILENFDFIFLPPWEIEHISSNTIDLAINKNSLGEMNPETAKNYINHIHRTSNFFFSMNHESIRNKFSDNKESLINSEYNNGKFKQLIRYPDLSHLIYENNMINFESDIFFYLYEKIK